MAGLLGKAAIAIAAAGAFIGLAASPSLAAVTAKQMEICNDTPAFDVGGHGSCATLQGWWWKSGTIVGIEFNGHNSPDNHVDATVYIDPNANYTMKRVVTSQGLN